MANVTIPNLTSATSITPSSDLLVVEQTNGTRKATASQLFTSSATSGSALGITSGGVYTIKSGLDSDISDINTLLGNTSIASIGNGTVTGAISTLNTDLSAKQNKTDTSLNTTAKTVVGAINELKTTSDLRPFELHGGCPNNNSNWANLNGIYSISPSTEGTPNYYGIVVVFAMKNTGFDGSNWIFQLFFPTGESQIYMRMSANATGGGEWSSWVTLR